MQKNTITVKIEGTTNTGKSSITLAIIKLLQENGFDVNLDAVDHLSIEHLQKSMEHDITLEKRLSYVSEKTKVLVKEIQIEDPKKTKIQNKIDLFNVEGSIFYLSKDDTDLFSIYNSYKKLRTKLSKDAVYSFLDGKIVLVDDDNVEWNYKLTNSDLKTSVEKIKNFINN